MKIRFGHIDDRFGPELYMELIDGKNIVDEREGVGEFENLVNEMLDMLDTYRKKQPGLPGIKLVIAKDSEKFYNKAQKDALNRILKLYSSSYK